ncbi:MAG: NAD(P)-dependent glycerol-3-phosphate dehydrogenase [Verrucomicrobia bacterium]|nr:NAD(P)-dependent glycerol-3-phosphate dehydrogenase [Verrucomicrobiota bacterium]
MRVTVLGAGGWGTALGRLLARARHEVTLWGHDPRHLEEMGRSGFNVRYLPGIDLPKDWRLEKDLVHAAAEAECVVVAVPSKAFREVTQHLESFEGIVVSVTKGIEHDTGLTMCGIVRSTAPKATPVALSGPTLAPEVAHDVPTACVVAGDDAAASQTVQQLFHRPTFRVYTSGDVTGVELGGALKNVIAIAAGMCDGLGFGDNSKAALITRAIVEIRRLGVAAGAQPETFSGLSGLGDLAVTCFSRLSRNRGLGERLARGEKLQEILASTPTVAEGVPTAQSAFELARKLHVVTPILDEVYAMLYEGKNIGQALRDLTSRDSKAED